MRAVLVSLAVLASSLPSRAQEPVFPADFCGSLPALDPESKAWLDQNAPEFASVPAKVLEAGAARELLGKAVDGGWSSLQLFTQDAIRQGCAVVLGPRTVEAIRGSFELFLISPLEGKDTKGNAFSAQAIVFGDGLVRIYYDRGAFRHKHVHFDETFSYASPVKMRTPEAGTLKLEGITGPFGLSITGLELEGDKVVVQAGPFSAKRDIRRIKRLDGAGAMLKPAPSSWKAFRLPDAEAAVAALERP